MKILFLSVTVPFPATDGGRLRVLNLLKQVARTHQVTFLALETQPTDVDGIAYLRQLGVDAHLVSHVTKMPPITVCNGIHGFLRQKPITLSRYDVPAFRETFHSLLERSNFDVIHYEMFHAAQFRVETNIPSVLSLQNIDSMIWQRLRAHSSNPLRRFSFWTQERLFHRYEQSMVRKFDIVACTSEVDRRFIQQIGPGLNTDVIPNGVDIELYRPAHTLEETATLIYTGSMDWLPNEDAAIYFADKVLPKIKEKHPKVKFYVVGQYPTERLQRIGNRPGITVTGRVDDVKPYIARATVYVVPLRIGGGTRLKILEALAMEKAVVSTTVGAEGLNLKSGEQIVIADPPDQIAHATIELMANQAMRRRLGKSGRQLIEASYDWRHVGRKLHTLYATARKR